MKTVVLVLMFLTIAAWAADDEEEKECEDHDECADDQCCIFNKGKKICRPLQQEGEYCFSNATNEPEGGFVYYCPCAEGLACLYEEFPYNRCREV